MSLSQEAKQSDYPMHGANGEAWPTLTEAIVVWSHIALLSFGGPAGQIAVMHRILVEEKRWLGEERFLHALNFCMLLPGPEAQQLAVYIGWLMHRTIGGFIAGILFVLPGLFAIMSLSWVYSLYGDLTFVSSMFFGLKAAVLAIVLNAVVRIAKKSLKNSLMIGISIASFIAIYFFGVPFPLIILVAGIVGYLGSKLAVSSFNVDSSHGSMGGQQVADAETILGEGIPVTSEKGSSGIVSTAVKLLVAWMLPTAVLWVWLGPTNVFSEIAVFFSQMAVVTFGGAYAVLAYVAQAAVESHGWLKPGEMLDGLGMAETTPGPLIMVTQFVGYMGAFREPGVLSPVLAGTLGGLLTTWVTFVPCFLWIFLGAPYIEKLRENATLSSALTAITAAVVGVVLNLAIWFSIHVLFREVGELKVGWLEFAVPTLGSVNIVGLVLSVLALLAVFRFKVGTVVLLLGAAITGIALGAMGLLA